jgi:hypothetical protein
LYTIFFLQRMYQPVSSLHFISRVLIKYLNTTGA